mgnify:CR=1 FL=1
MGIQLEVLGLGTTGYGEQMLSSAFHADYHTVETVAHARGCRRFFPDATFLLDIGGQDSKVICLDETGGVTNFVMNDKCAAGTGRFLELMARTLELNLDEMARVGLHWEQELTISSMCHRLAESGGGVPHPRTTHVPPPRQLSHGP